MNMNVDAQALPPPWYKQAWPWALIAGPAIVVVAGFVTLYLALNSFDGMVEDDYYRQGLAINQVIERDQKAESLGLSAQIMIGEEGKEVRVLLSGNEGVELPERLVLRFYHPTRDGMDRDVELSRAGDGFYSGHLESLSAASSRWHLSLEDSGEAWRLFGDWRPADGGALRLPQAKREVIGVPGGLAETPN
ncbi:MAG: FixH family protein [Zoogloeaceae bacterium]|nr:FixH family protein [Zoogloeaceae bacterium]